jgi:hypothetical protein
MSCSMAKFVVLSLYSPVKRLGIVHTDLPSVRYESKPQPPSFDRDFEGEGHLKSNPATVP